MHLSHNDIFDKFSLLHIAVVGDVMLDNYHWGKVERMSPEAPVPVVDIYKKETRLGGAANVALNCAALHATTTLLSVIGDDDEGKQMCTLLEANGLDTQHIRKSRSRITTSKTRILSRNQQMMRLDNETTEELDTADEHAFIDSTLRFLQIQRPDMVILQDYNKGVLKENVIQKIISHCKSLHIPVAVDPKLKNFLAYKEVDIFKPNLKEVREGLKRSLENVELAALDEIHDALHEALGNKISFITLSEHGVYFHDEKSSEIIPSHLRNIADVSGAGDTVIAVAAMVYAITKDAATMAAYSNIAGGLVCEEPGAKPINKQKFESEVKRLLS